MPCESNSPPGATGNRKRRGRERIGHNESNVGPVASQLSRDREKASRRIATAASASDISLSNLSLELLRTDLAGTPSLIAQSIASVSTVEFLRLSVPQTGSYMLRVVGLNQNYNLAATPTNTSYGLAWTVIVPEPSTWLMLAIAALLKTVAVTKLRRPRAFGSF